MPLQRVTKLFVTRAPPVATGSRVFQGPSMSARRSRTRPASPRDLLVCWSRREVLLVLPKKMGSFSRSATRRRGRSSLTRSTTVGTPARRNQCIKASTFVGYPLRQRMFVTAAFAGELTIHRHLASRLGSNFGTVLSNPIDQHGNRTGWTLSPQLAHGSLLQVERHWYGRDLVRGFDR